MIRVRFAPSPHGHLFVSGARVALMNFLHARRHKGHLLLRFDDTDRDRSKPAYTESILHDLRWLGIAWDETFNQSDRLSLYEEAAQSLIAAGRVYPCFESPEELRAKQDFRVKRGQSPVYDRAMLRLTPEQRAAAEAGGKKPHWRFRLSNRTLEWPDIVLGPRQAKLPAVSDPILIRADGSVAPMLASVVDDMASGITHVIRAEDNAANTGIQIELFSALGMDPSRLTFGHLPPLGGAEGKAAGLAGRIGSMSIRALRGDGVQASAIVACLAQPVSQTRVKPGPTAGLAEHFMLSSLSRTNAKFDTANLLRVNREVLRTTDFADVADRLPSGATEAFWGAVRGHIDLLNEARGWWDVVSGTIVPPEMEDERAFLRLAEESLPAEPWDGDVWSAWLAALRESTGRSGGALITPLRLALTGEEQGPDLADLLPLIGRARAVGRLGVASG